MEHYLSRLAIPIEIYEPLPEENARNKRNRPKLKKPRMTPVPKLFDES